MSKAETQRYYKVQNSNTVDAGQQFAERINLD